MSTDAIVVMVGAMGVVWGGLVLAVLNLRRHGPVEGRAETVRRDL